MCMTHTFCPNAQTCHLTPLSNIPGGAPDHQTTPTPFSSFPTSPMPPSLFHHKSKGNPSKKIPINYNPPTFSCLISDSFYSTSPLLSITPLPSSENARRRLSRRRRALSRPPPADPPPVGPIPISSVCRGRAVFALIVISPLYPSV